MNKTRTTLKTTQKHKDTKKKIKTSQEHNNKKQKNTLQHEQTKQENKQKQNKINRNKTNTQEKQKQEKQKHQRKEGLAEVGPLGPHLTLNLPNPNKQEQTTPQNKKTGAKTSMLTFPNTQNTNHKTIETSKCKKTDKQTPANQPK